MKLSAKKVIAREFLIFLSCIILAFFIFLGTILYNYIFYQKSNMVKDLVESISNKADSLEYDYVVKSNSQQVYYNAFTERFEFGDKGRIEFWNRSEELIRNDSLIYLWNNRWNSVIKESFKEIGYSNVNDLVEFIRINSHTSQEIRNKSAADSLKNEIRKLNQEIRYYKSRSLYTNEENILGLISLTILAIIAFPLRYGVLSVRWSIRTLKQK